MMPRTNFLNLVGATLFMISTMGMNCVGKPRVSVSCTNPIRIKETKAFVPTISKGEYKAIINVYPNKIKVDMAKRSRWTKYCYDGTFLDPNTGCTEKYENVFPAKKEVKEWATRGMCKIGHVCEPYGDCWGVDAQKCLSSDIKDWVVGSKIRSMNGHWTKFPYHTCISQWECQYHRTNLPAVLKCGRIPRLITSLPNGTSVPVDSIDSMPVGPPEDVVLYTDMEELTPSTAIVSTTCFAQEENILCMLNGGIPNIERGTVFNVDPTSMCGCSGATHLCLDDKISYYKEGLKITYSGNKTHASSPLIEPFSAVASVTVKQLSNDIRATQIQSNYNIIKIAEALNKIHSVIDDIIVSVSKIDEKLLGKILKVERATQWVNDDLVRFCDLPNPIISGQSNCVGDLIYKMGRSVTRKTNDICFSTSEGDTLNINIFQGEDLNFNTISAPTFVAAHEDFEGWQWVSSVSSTIQDFFSLASNEKRDDKEYKGWVSGVYFFDVLTKWFVGLSSFVSWLTLLFVLCGRR